MKANVLATGSRSPVAGIVAVTTLAVAAFVLRLVEIDQSLFGDELFTYRIATENQPRRIFGDVADTAITPPLHYLLAWLAVQVGDPTISIRLPSLILGAATVPLVYALGLRTVGRGAAFVGSALVAISPFAIFYGVESRAYATLSFLSALSTLALLRALRQGGVPSWLAYGVSAAAVLYTHYTGVFVVLGQFGWALWTYRNRWRELALVHAAVALAYVPWLPSLVNQHDLASTQARDFTNRFPLSAETIADMTARFLPGAGEPSYLNVPLREVPGNLIVTIVWATIGVALVAAIVRAARRRRAGQPVAPSPRARLIVVLSLVTPIGLILYSVQPDTSWLVARNLSASLPALALLVAWLLTSLRAPVAAAGVATVVAGLLVGAVQTLDDDHQRPPYRQVAQFIDREAAHGDVVVQSLSADNVFSKPLPVHFERAHPILRTGEADRRSWAQAAGAERVFILALAFGTRFERPPARWSSPLGDRFALESHRVYPGAVSLGVSEYARELVEQREDPN